MSEFTPLCSGISIGTLHGNCVIEYTEIGSGGFYGMAMSDSSNLGRTTSILGCSVVYQLPCSAALDPGF